MCCLTTGVKCRFRHQELSGSRKGSHILANLSVITQDVRACFCRDPSPETQAHFCSFLSVTWVRTNRFWSTRIVIAEVHSKFSSAMLGFALPGVDRRFHCSDIYGCVSSWKQRAVVTGSWQVQEKSKWSFIGIVLFLKIPFRRWNKKYWRNWDNWPVKAC